jgi:ribosomal protein L11 methyltransferase
MTRVVDDPKASGTTGPPEELYIYLLRGPVEKRDEPRFGPDFLGNWVEDDTSFLFFSRPSGDVVSRFLKHRGGIERIEEHCFTYEQWQGGGLEPVRVERFFIAPPWWRGTPDGGGIQLILDPGVVFGNGLHPTTKDCLKALSQAQKNRPFQRVLDLGTGTGILALAAGFLGAEKILAVDLNPLCVKTARKNVGLNKMGKHIRVVEGTAEGFLGEPADLVVANLHFDVTRKILRDRVFRHRDRLILSGLMRSQSREVRAQLNRLHLRILREWEHEMIWFTFLIEKRG